MSVVFFISVFEVSTLQFYEISIILKLFSSDWIEEGEKKRIIADVGVSWCTSIVKESWIEIGIFGTYHRFLIKKVLVYYKIIHINKTLWFD